MIYLILSISCSTIIFVLFRLFARYKVSNLQAIVGNYFVAGALGWTPYITHSDVPHPASWNYWPILIGVLFITLFQLMARVTQERGVNAVSVTVKMSVMIPILFGIFLYGEVLTWLNGLGIILALLAVYLINAGKKNEKTKANLPKYSLLGAIVLFLGSGLLDALLNVVKEDYVLPRDLSAFTSTTFATAGILGSVWVLVRIYVMRNLQWNWRSWIWGFVLGIPNFGSIYFLLEALNGNLPSAILFPINNVGVVGLSALVAFTVFSEKITFRKISGLTVAALAIILMSL